MAGLSVLARFSPRFDLRILPRWVDAETQRVLILRFEIENTSRIRSGRPQVHMQVRHETLEEGRSLSEWIPFLDDADDEAEKPVRLFDTTDRVYPGEVLAGERVIDFPGEDVLHVGLRVQLFGWPGDATAGERDETARLRHQQTTTCFVVKKTYRPTRS